MSLRLRHYTLKHLRRMLGRIRGFLRMSFYNESRDYTMKLFVPENFCVCVCVCVRLQLIVYWLQLGMLCVSQTRPSHE